MLAGGMAEGAEGTVVSAYVALSAGRQSRLFRVSGPATAAKVVELKAATTVDTRRFQREIEEDLAPVLAAGKAGEAGQIRRPEDGWVTGFVRRHLETTEGLIVD